jgi:hypothetical protein
VGVMREYLRHALSRMRFANIRASIQLRRRRKEFGSIVVFYIFDCYIHYQNRIMEESTAAIIIMTLFIGSVLAIITGIKHLLGRWRSKNLREMAANLSLPFSEQKDEALLMFLRPLPLFSKGHSKVAKNIFTADTAQVVIRVFDYEYTEGSGRGSSNPHFSVLMGSSKLYQLPAFTMSKAHNVYKVLSFFGFSDINFEEAPLFSKHYWLTGKDGAGIKAFFTPERLQFFEEHLGLNIEAQGDTFIMYVQPRLSAIDIAGFLQEGLEVAEIMKTGTYLEA